MKPFVEQPRKPIVAMESDGSFDDIIPGPPSSNIRRVFSNEVLDASNTEHHVKGSGILASRRDLEMNAKEFAAGCVLLQAAARGDLANIEKLLKINPHHVNFRDCKSFKRESKPSLCRNYLIFMS
jgi:hypothetical protein